MVMRKFTLPGIQDLTKEQEDARALPKKGQHLIGKVAVGARDLFQCLLRQAASTGKQRSLECGQETQIRHQVVAEFHGNAGAEWAAGKNPGLDDGATVEADLREGIGAAEESGDAVGILNLLLLGSRSS